MSGWYLLNHRTFCYQTWYGDAASWTRVSSRGKKSCSLSSRSRSWRGLIWSKYDSFYSIFWTADSSATKFDLMIHHHKPECPVKKIGLLHSRSRSHQRVKMSVFVRLVSSKLPNVLLPTFELWCIIASQNVMQKDWFAIFKIKVTARAHDQNMTVSTISSEFLLYLLNCWIFCF